MLKTHIVVAKRTFYHYFKSKEDLLTQWVLYEMEPVIAQYRKIAVDSDMDAISKINLIFAQSRKWKLERLELLHSLMRVLHYDHNLRLRVEGNRKSVRMSMRYFKQKIRVLMKG